MKHLKSFAKSTRMTDRLKKRTAALFLAAALCLSAIGTAAPVPAEAASKQEWGVIIGTTLGGNTSRVKNYKNIVVDVQYYYPDEIKKLKSGGRKVYSYMSIGSLETYRPYYKRSKNHTLGKYDHWGDELWMDVSCKGWQDFIVNELVASVRRKGCDGLWLDNFDVYYKYHRESIYQGLLNILTRLYKKNIPVYINGGDEFVTKLLSQGRGRLIRGVFQEEVITAIKGYSSNRFGRQSASDRKFFTSYLKKVKKAGKSVTLLEYTKDTKIRNEVVSFCKKNGYSYYISTDVHLR